MVFVSCDGGKDSTIKQKKNQNIVYCFDCRCSNEIK